jgi:hypothetical protein
MKKILFSLVASVLLIPAFKVFGQEAQAPVYQDGECWLFRSVSKNYQGYVSGVLALPANGEHKICFLQGKFFEIDGDTKSVVSTAGLWNSILYMAETRELKFPLVVGQKRTEEFKTRVRGTNRLEPRRTEIQVVDIDQIMTPAGAYRSFKIHRDDWWYGKLVSKWIYFYSPETKSIVKYNYEALVGSTATWEVDLIKFLPVQ